MSDGSGSWDLVSELFDRLQGAGEEEILAALTEVDIDEQSEALLRKMLAADQNEQILDRSVDELAADILGDSALDTLAIPDDLVGTRFGAWRVIREIDRGGMGAVFQAERADGQFEKTVALKIIKPGRYSQLTKQNFLDEMQMLARLEHPNIVRLIDGGISDASVPWFTMEYVEGSPITVHADEHKLTIEARIALLVEVCRAVEHAHRNLIVHGDIKPSNILVTTRGQIKLVDFGIARSLRDEDSVAPLPRFTPRYASPELAGGNPMTTVSDVFGLCAVLYELLSGLAPRSKELSYTHADSRSLTSTPIRHVSENYDTSTEREKIAGNRHTSAASLRRRLKGDLRWILELGLAIEAGDRFSSVFELRHDLTRYLESKPVDAHPPSNTYRLGKFLQRYRWSVALGTAALVALGSTAAIATHQASLARQQAENARWTSNFLIELFDTADPWRNQQQPITVNEIAASAVQDLLQDRPHLASGTRAAAASILARVEGRLGHLESSEQLLKLQIGLIENDAGPTELAKALLELGRVLTNQAEFDAADKVFRRAYELQPITAEPNATAVSAAVELAYALASAQNPEASREILLDLFEIEIAIKSVDNAESLLALMYNTQSLVLQQDGDYSGAAVAAEQSIEYAKAAGGDSSVIVGKTLLALAEAFHQTGDSKSAIELDRQVADIFETYYGIDHPQTLESRGRLAVSLSNLGRMEEAIVVYEDVLQGQTMSLGRENRFVASTLLNLGAAYLAMQNPETALKYYSDATPIWESLEPGMPVYEAVNAIGIARCLHRLGHLQDSQAAFDSSLALVVDAVGLTHPIYFRAQVYRAPLLFDVGQLAEAGQILPTAYAAIVEAYGHESKHTALAGLRWAQLLARNGEQKQAADIVRKSIEVFDTDANRLRHAKEIEESRELLANLD